MLNYIFQDAGVNRGNWLAVFLLIQYRALSLMCRFGRMGELVAMPLWIVYKIYSMAILNCEISPRTKIGRRLMLPHPYGVIVNVGSVIGDDCMIRHNVTIGNKGAGISNSCPIIEDRVEFGCNAVVIGGIRLGVGVKIGAGAVVTRDVASGGICVGPRAEIL